MTRYRAIMHFRKIVNPLFRTILPFRIFSRRNNTNNTTCIALWFNRCIHLTSLNFNHLTTVDNASFGFTCKAAILDSWYTSRRHLPYYTTAIDITNIVTILNFTIWRRISDYTTHSCFTCNVSSNSQILYRCTVYHSHKSHIFLVRTVDKQFHCFSIPIKLSLEGFIFRPDRHPSLWRVVFAKPLRQINITHQLITGLQIVSRLIEFICCRNEIGIIRRSTTLSAKLSTHTDAHHKEKDEKKLFLHFLISLIHPAAISRLAVNFF